MDSTAKGFEEGWPEEFEMSPRDYLPSGHLDLCQVKNSTHHHHHHLDHPNPHHGRIPFPSPFLCRTRLATHHLVHLVQRRRRLRVWG